jgi:hypothetical protein
MNSEVSHYRMRLLDSLSEIGQEAWDDLVRRQDKPNPFLSFAFLHALHESGSACASTGWKPCYLTLWEGDQLVAAMPLYEKSHSYGEYVFDWAWANAYHQHGLNYYPKLLSAIPFTPVEGNRLLSRSPATRDALMTVLRQLLALNEQSSAHILFPTKAEIHGLEKAGFLIRQGVQFHWTNNAYRNFEDFLSQLEYKKRKNIRAERRKVHEAGITFQQISGLDIREEHWHFFKQCYDQTYTEHHSTPYLNLDFFLRIGKTMPQHIHMILGLKDEKAVAASLLIYNETTLYGRYWGSIQYYPCLHFETAYYQALEFCIANKIQIFEGGAQGEHKMARGFLPHKTYSAHLLNEPAFADAIAHFLAREQTGIDEYVNELIDRTPFKNEWS